MANADGPAEVEVDSVHEGNVKTEENGESTTEFPYVMEIEVNADGEVVDQSSHKIQREQSVSHTDGNPVPVTELAVHDAKEFDAIKSMHNYFQQPISSNERKMKSNNVNVDASTTEDVVDHKLLENIAKVVNSNVGVVHDNGQVIIVVGQDCELSDSDLEAIKLQVAKSEEREEVENTEVTEDNPVPEPSCFTEQASEFSSSVAKDSDTNEIHICYQCKAEFSSANELVYHFVQEHSTSVQCQHCDMVFPSIADANQHKKQRHIEIQCTMCKKKYYGTLSLNQHIKLRHSKGTKCGTCYKYFDSREEMLEHIEQEHKIHKCMFCGKGFYFKTSLANHIESEHGLSTLDSNIMDTNITVEGNYHQVKFVPADKMAKLLEQNGTPDNKPIESHKTKPGSPSIKNSPPAAQEESDVSVVQMPICRKSPRKPTLTCIYCGEGFYFKLNMAKHINMKHLKPADHSTVDTSALNDLVGRTYKNSTEPLQTTKTTTGTTDDKTHADKPIKSSKSIKFDTPLIKEEQLTERTTENGTEIAPHALRKSPRKRVAEDFPPRAKKSNQDKTPYKCSQCGTSFKNVTESEPVLMYSKHMAQKHSDFVCKKCEVDYKDHRSFMTHMKSKHEMPTAELICEYCYEEFRTKRTFDVHTKDNWKRCPIAVACTHCSQVFVSTTELASHNKKRHKGKPVH